MKNHSAPRTSLLQRAFFHALTLLILFALVSACETSQGEPGPTGPPEQVEFAVDARGVYYAQLMPDGTRSATMRLGHIPASERVAAIILIDGETPEVEGHHYTADLVDVRPGQRLMATLSSVESILPRLEVGREGARQALVTFDTARGWADILDEIRRDELLREAAARADARADARASKAAANPPQKAAEPIEIYRIGAQGAGLSSPEQAALFAQSLGATNWKPVVLYYTDWCGHCTRARTWLKENKVPHQAINIETSETGQTAMNALIRSKKGRPGALPTFLIGDELMQGWNADRFRMLAKN